MSNLRDQLLSSERPIGIFGLGYIGLNTALFFARQGVRSIGVDIDHDKVQTINEGRLPIKELQYWLTFNTESLLKEFIQATTSADDLARAGAPVVFVAVPTERDGAPWWDALADVISKVKDFEPQPLVIVESTLSPGTSKKYIKPYIKRFAVASRRDWYGLEEPGRTLKNLPRIVGGSSPEATEEAVNVLSIVCDHLLPCDYKEAELVKSLENSIRHLGSVYAQELALAYPNLDTRLVLQLASTKWNIPLFYPNLLGTGGYACDSETEILTENGWARWDEIAIGQKVVTLNLETGDLEYQPIRGIMREKYKGEMVRIKSQTMDQLLHPQHRVVVKRKVSPKRTRPYDRPYRILEAGELRHGPYAIPCSGHPLRPPDAISVNPYFARVLGWVFAEGYLNTVRPNSPCWELGQSKYRDQLEADLERSGVKWSRTLHSRGGTVNKVGVRTNTDFYKYRIWVADSRRISQFITPKGQLTRDAMRLSPEAKEHFLAALLLGDGDGVNRIWSKDHIDQIHEFAILAGYRANASYGSRPPSIRLFRRRPTALIENHHRHGRRSPHHISHVPYAGTIWCINTANGTFVARRNGKAFITGNCIPLSSRYVLQGAEEPGWLTLASAAIETDDHVSGVIAAIIQEKWAEQRRKGRKIWQLGILGVSYLGNLKVPILSGARRFLAWLSADEKQNVRVNDPLYTDGELWELTGCETFKFPDELDQFDMLMLTAGHDPYRAVPKSLLVEKTKDAKFIFDNTAIWEGIPFKCPLVVTGRAGWLRELHALTRNEDA